MVRDLMFFQWRWLMAGLLSISALGSDNLPRGSRVLPSVWTRCIVRLLTASDLQPQPEYMEWQGKPMPVPFGFKAPAFQQLVLNAFRTRSSLEVLVFYGSRTHFQYGYYPERDSDLDALGIEVQGTPSDAELFSTPGFAVHWRRGVVPTVESVLNFPDFSFPASREEDIEMHRSAWERARSHFLISGDWKCEWEKIVERRNPRTIEERLRAGHDRFSMGPSPVQCSLGKESLLFLRKGPATPTHMERFRQLGFAHIGVVEVEQLGAE